MKYLRFVLLVVICLLAGSSVVQGIPCDPCDTTWSETDYLLWWGKGMWVPPLVTTNPSAVPDLSNPNTTILFGNESILQGDRPGFRIRVGKWLDTDRTLGIEAEYFHSGQVSTSFFAEGDGNSIIGRPFFNVNPRTPFGAFDPPPRESAELVSFPGWIAGSVSVDASSRVNSAGIRAVVPICCRSFCYRCEPVRTCWNFLAGYRHMNLSEDLVIREDLVSLGPPGEFDITDAFRTRNDFHGLELGMQWRLERDRWMLQVLGKLALGNNSQVVRIAGTTTITNSGASDGTYVGGLLAQQSNIGSYHRNRFAMVPELGAKLGYQLTERLSVTCGYSLVYFSGVVRPGEHVDLDVNPDFLPPPPPWPFAGVRRPAFAFNDTDFWVQGLDLGLEYRY